MRGGRADPLFGTEDPPSPARDGEGKAENLPYVNRRATIFAAH